MEELDFESLAFDFFREFARCEYCLKAVGLREKGRDAKANWGAFSSEVREVLESAESAELKAAVDYYLEKSPKKQIVKDGQLDWDPKLPDHAHQAELILRLVCRVRNNLFHGGKFNGHVFAPQRSEELLRHGLVIIRNCVAKHPKVHEAYVCRAV